MLKTIAVLFVLMSSAWAQITIDVKGTVSGPGFVPYTGATADVNLGARKMSAGEFEVTSTTPSRISMRQGACPTTPPVPYDGVVCMEGAAVFLVTPTAKLPLTPTGPTAPETIKQQVFMLSALTISPTGQSTVTLTNTPKPGSSVRLYRRSSVAADSSVDEVIVGPVATRTVSITSLPVRTYTTEDFFKIIYTTLE
jgi:hypothetical protein